MTRSFSEALIEEIARLLSPLKDLATPARMTSFIKALGNEFEDAGEITLNLTDLVNSLDSLIDAIRTEADEELIIEQSLEVVVETREIVPEAEAVFTGFTIDSQRAGELAKLLVRRLFDYLVYQNLRTYHRGVFAISHLLGIAETVETETGHLVETIHWYRIGRLFTSPMENFNEVYAWEMAFDGDELLNRLELVLQVLGLPGGIYRQSDSLRAELGRLPWSDREIRIPVFSHSADETYAEIDLNLSPLPATADLRPGLLLYPYLSGDVEINEDLDGNWTFELKGNADLGAGLGLELRPPTNLTVRNNLLSGPPETLDTHLELGITRKSPGGEMNLIFGSEDGSRLGFRELGFNLYLAMEGGAYLIAAEVEIEDFTLVVDAGDGDGFIQKILSGIVLESVNDLVIGVSNKEGFYFRGSSALSVTIPIYRNLGPIDLNTVLIGVELGDEIKLILAVSFGVQLGPVAGSVKNIGLKLPMSFPDDGDGNLGPINVEGIEFLPPTGAGLVVDAGGITGGGYLEFDRDNERYAGILELNFGEIGLVAIGLITTRLPDGRKVFSMLIIIGVEFSPVIQLSFGFTLSAVGGLIGINRQANVDFLREGLRAKTLDSVLFPENPIANADLVISNLRNAFPPTEGRFIVGPMVKIGWGSPNIITADICILLELPSPIRIILLGQIEAQLPEAEEALIVLHVDVLGVLDFSKKSLAFDGTIYDSRILTYTLTGDAALRLNWGDNPDFAMSLGGFHPRYSPPPGFPSLRRLTLALSAGSNLQLSSQIYQALTANTVQFGSKTQLYAKFAGAELEGHLGFDTLIYFSPFSFVATMRAGVSIRYKGRRLASVRLYLELSGPSPWHAVGEASFSILLWDVSVDFDKTWGPRRTVRLEPINPWIPLEQALLRGESWAGALGRVQQVENFVSAKIDEVESDATDASRVDKPVLIHPAGGLEIRENVLPLNHSLKLMGNALVKTYNRFEVQEIHSSTDDNFGGWSYIDEFFARAQFDSFSSSQKLSLPSFERMPGGIEVAGREELQVPSGMETEELAYESILIDDDGIVQVQTLSAAIAWDFSRVLMDGTAQNLKMQSGDRRFHQKEAEKRVAIQDEFFVIVDRINLQPVEQLNGGYPLNRAAADSALSQAKMENAAEANQYIVVSASELEIA